MDAKSQLKQILDPIKDLLAFGKKTVVGVDIGLSGVKVAQVHADHEKGEYTLQKFAMVPLPEGALIEDEIQKHEEVAEAIVEALKKAEIETTFLCLGLSGPNTIVKRLQVAGGSDDEVEDQVLWEAEQYLPFDIEESSISFHVVGENEGGGIDVIVAAARNDVIESFRAVVEKAELKIKILDLGITAITNVFELVMKEKQVNEHESTLLLDIGAQKTSFIIYKNGMIFFSKEINVGGVMITEEIQRQMGVNYYEAEDLKITGDENGNLPEEILAIIDDVVEAFFSEIKKTIDFYVSSTSDESMASCVVTGGSVLIPGLLEGLEALLGVDVIVLNPFEKMKYDAKNFSEDEINLIAYRGAQVLGLGMRTV